MTTTPNLGLTVWQGTDNVTRANFNAQFALIDQNAAPRSTIGSPVGATGATAVTRYVGGTASGAPTTGTFNLGDFVIDQTGAVWICTVAGTPGTWKSATPSDVAKLDVANTWSAQQTFGTIVANAFYSGTAAFNMVPESGGSFTMSNAANNKALLQVKDSDNSVHAGNSVLNDGSDNMTVAGGLIVNGGAGRVIFKGADGSNNLWFGTGKTSEPGDLAFGWQTDASGNVTGVTLKHAVTTDHNTVDDGYGNNKAVTYSPIGLTGATAATRYVGGTTSGAPTSGTFVVGDWVRDQAGQTWTCTVAGSPGTWVKGGASHSQSRVSILRNTTGLSTTSTTNTQPAYIFQFAYHASEWTSNSFYFEASISSTGTGTVYAGLWDVTAGSVVSGSEVSVTSTTANTVRSANVSLTDGHMYAVYYRSVTSATAWIYGADVLYLN